MDDFERALQRIEWEDETAGRYRKDLERRVTLLLGELRSNRRLLEAGQFSDIGLLDQPPDLFLLDLEHWQTRKIVELLSLLPGIRQYLIDLDQDDVLKTEFALEAAMRKLWSSNGYADEWRYDREYYPNHPNDEDVE